MTRDARRQTGPVAVAACIVAAAAGLGAGQPRTRPQAPPGRTIVSERDFWRKHYTFFPGRVSAESARRSGIGPEPASRAAALAKVFPSGFVTPPPPEGCQQPGFDDTGWLLRRGREFVTGDGRLMEYDTMGETNTWLRGGDPFVIGVGLIAQRCRFGVSDPGKVRSLKLSLTYRGGFVAHLNGTEIARANLPPGPLQPQTPADNYPLEAFFYAEGNQKGKYLNAFDKNAPFHLRERVFGPVDVPTDLLRRGENVLSLQLHRSDYPAECASAKSEYGWQRIWATVGLSVLDLRAEGDEGAITPAGAVRKGFQAWTVDMARPVSDRGCPNADEGPGTMRLVGCRNGRFAGQVVLAGEEALEGVSAAASELRQRGGAGRIPAEAIRIRYATANPLRPGGLGYLETVVPADMQIGKGGVGTRLDLLLDDPPAGVSTMSVVATVRVPRGAPAGTYAGELTVRAGGAGPVRVPIELYVADWTLPDVNDSAGTMNTYQSPETLAEYYGVEHWSEQAWRLTERSLKLMAEGGNVGLFIPLLAQSQRGNADSYVAWVRQADGSYTYDFALMDRYLDAAMKYHDPKRLFFICLVIWGYEGDKDGTLVTVAERGTGAKGLLKLPTYGTEECEKRLTPLLHAVRDRLKARGLDGKILIGQAWDVGPKWQTVAMFRRILPEVGWLTESHMRQWTYPYDPQDKKAVVPIRYNSVVWGGEIPDPAVKRYHGWKHGPERLMMNFNRVGVDCLVLTGYPPPWSFRTWMESTLTCSIGRNGNGNVGGDYWPIADRLIHAGRYTGDINWNGGGTLYGIYPASNVGRTGVGNNTVDLFGPGPDGPVSTIRFENALEGNQAAEARAFIEKALLDQSRPLPDDVARLLWAMLDERLMHLRMWAIGAAGIAPYRWQERDKALYDAAGQVAKHQAGQASTSPVAKGD